MVRRKFRVYTCCSFIAMPTMFIPILIRLPVVTISTFHYVFYGCDSILLYKANISDPASIYPYHRNIPHSNNGNVDILLSVHLNFFKLTSWIITLYPIYHQKGFFPYFPIIKSSFPYKSFRCNNFSFDMFPLLF